MAGWPACCTGKEGRDANAWIKGVMFVNKRISQWGRKCNLDHGQSTQKALKRLLRKQKNSQLQNIKPWSSVQDYKNEEYKENKWAKVKDSFCQIIGNVTDCVQITEANTMEVLTYSL